MKLNYQFHIAGSIQASWSEWFYNLDIIPQADNTTLLVGVLEDQAALHGVLNKIRDLGLELISMKRLNFVKEN